MRFFEKNGFKTLFSREIDEDLYTKPPKDENEHSERKKNPCLMFCDLLNEE